ncbi:hypothetical protein OUZ56_032118 [Daphnia magna]|uniref:Uncharacterized protein n=1 Tax=Daphnia magna TaxID=35525 RepID=A0ABQ9ZWA2_9CRUS|nr:hypothetical protein OUZ56_032118 [Daphnia magna]
MDYYYYNLRTGRFDNSYVGHGEKAARRCHMRAKNPNSLLVFFLQFRVELSIGGIRHFRVQLSITKNLRFLVDRWHRWPALFPKVTPST